MLQAAFCSLVVAALVIRLPSGAGAASQGRNPPVNVNAAVMQDFLKRVDVYVALHKKLEDTLPNLPAKATPQQMDTHERALGQLIQGGHKGAKQGDIFTPGMQRVIRTLLRPIFSGAGGIQIKKEILDNEYKGNVRLAVNGRYPDDIPISTMPPQVLAALPKLPEALEYRFLQNTLILFDPHAHIIIDYMLRAFN